MKKPFQFKYTDEEVLQMIRIAKRAMKMTEGMKTQKQINKEAKKEAKKLSKP